MTFGDYVKICQQFLKENPQSADAIAVYAKDDEGNGYDPVYYTPSLGFMDENRDFYGINTPENDLPSKLDVVVCIQ